MEVSKQSSNLKISNSLWCIVKLNRNFKSGEAQLYFLVSELLWDLKWELRPCFPEKEGDKRSHFLEIKPSNSNKDLTGAERCNSFFPVPVGLSWFSLVFVRSVRNVWIRSFGAVPRTWFMWYQRILMFCQGPFCHWEFRGWVCKGLAELQYKENSWATYSGRPSSVKGHQRAVPAGSTQKDSEQKRDKWQF